MLSSIKFLQDNKKDVSYDVETLFANIPIEETINCITEQIYVQQIQTPICSKLIVRRLLIKHATCCTFKFNNQFLKQVDSCFKTGPLSVTFSDGQNGKECFNTIKTYFL